MKRREFFTLLGGVAGWPLAARAQQPAMPVVGFLNSGGRPSENILGPFRKGLNETGYIEGRNVAIEFRGVDGQYDRLPALAADLVRRRVAVIVASGSPSVPAAKAATTTIPIVFVGGVDPIESGFVASLNRPGGNLTGASTLTNELGPKKLGLLRQLVPAATDFALLLNPTGPNAVPQSRELQTAARTLGLQLHILQASAERDFEGIFVTLAQQQSSALLIGGDVFFINNSEQLAALTVRHRVPAIFQYREFAAAGGLASYGGSNAEAFRFAGIYTGRILKGEKPADLPVQQSTKLELIINLHTAKALGLTVPQSLLVAADEVIE